MHSWISRLQKWNSSRLAEREQRRWRKWEVSEDEITISKHRGPPVRFNWNDIGEIVTFKRDLYIHDQICLGLRLKDSETYMQIEEDNPSWAEFLECLQAHFPLPENWQGEVMQPAFERKWTVLWPTSPA